MPFNGTVIAFGALVEYHPISAKDISRLPVKIIGGEQRLRTSTLTRDCPEGGEEQEILQGKSDELHSPTPHIKMTQRGMMRKLKVTSGLSQENSFIAITWNPESNCTCREKNHFLFR